MSQREMSTQLVRRIRVLDEDGTEHTIVEQGDFIRERFDDGTWTDWLRNGGRFLLKGKHAIPNADRTAFEVPATGEIFTVAPPDQ